MRAGRFIAGLALALSLAGGALAQEGAELYQTHCAACHQPAGEGLGTFPALAGNTFVQGDPHDVARVVLFGRAAMPPFANILDDDEIAAVVTFIRTSWGNDASEVEAETVAEVREAAAADDIEPVAVDLPDDWFELGEAAYLLSCAACHQASGEGIPGAFPPLAGNAFVQGSADELLRLILHGRAGMPAFAGSLDNETIALIASYVRNAWENEAHLIDAAMVEVVRGGGDLELAPTTPTYRPGAGE
jgi:cytochrome c oxidase subunit II